MTKTDLKKGKPFLRWAGSKRKILPKLQSYWRTDFTTYIEPFVGSAQLFFSIDSKKAVINDINTELINTYLQVKKCPEDVHYFLTQFTPSSRELFYQLRELDPLAFSKDERAAIFIYLNRYCFNGLYRTNNSGKFNVPFAGAATGKLPSLCELKLCANRLKKTRITNYDFEEVVKRYAKPNDFVYLDPPYAVNNKRIFQQYNPSSFGTGDLTRLKNLLTHMDNNNIYFLLSYAYTKETKDIFMGWDKKRIITQRNIAGFIKSRKRAAELLVTNIKR
jgi:DNA adenine methylase